MKLYNDDCLKVMKDIPDKSIDLVITDPPYEYRITKGGGFMTNENKKSLEELRIKSLDKGFNPQILKELVRVMKKINIYIWASKDQIPMLIKYFVEEIGCAFDILCWNKTNAMPLFNNKYLTDKEYCLYFRKGGYCQPISYECAKTIFNLSINYKDKKMYGHPTIKPLSIIKTMIQNSSKENDIVLDCFMGSGTTGVA